MNFLEWCGVVFLVVLGLFLLSLVWFYLAYRKTGYAPQMGTEWRRSR